MFMTMKRAGVLAPALICAAGMIGGLVAAPRAAQADLAATAAKSAAPASPEDASPQAAAPEPADEFYRPPMIGAVRHYVIEPGESLLDVGVKFNLGYVELVAANPGINVWVPKPGTRIVLPEEHLLPDAPHRGIVVNLPEMRLYYYPADAGGVVTFPIGIGVQGWTTPLGTTQVVSKQANPTWIPPVSIRAVEPDLPAAVPPGPDDPLGDYALYLGWPRYLIHGTNKPYGVGRRVSHGCIRLYPSDIERLFDWVPVGTPVTVVDQQAKLGWANGSLYLEVHPSAAQADQIELTSTFTPAPIPGLHDRIVAAAGSRVGQIDWKTVETAVRERRGIPVRILKGS